MTTTLRKGRIPKRLPRAEPLALVDDRDLIVPPDPLSAEREEFLDRLDREHTDTLAGVAGSTVPDFGKKTTQEIGAWFGEYVIVYPDGEPVALRRVDVQEIADRYMQLVFALFGRTKFGAPSSQERGRQYKLGRTVAEEGGD